MLEPHYNYPIDIGVAIISYEFQKHINIIFIENGRVIFDYIGDKKQYNFHLYVYLRIISIGIFILLFSFIRYYYIVITFASKKYYFQFNIKLRKYNHQFSQK